MSTLSVIVCAPEPAATSGLAAPRGSAESGAHRIAAVLRSIRAALMICLALLGSTSWARADFQVGVEAYRAKNYARAAAEFRGSAEKGNPEAAFRLAQLYEGGLGVTKDMAKAIDWYRKAADAGLVDAEVRLGEIYFYGTGVLQDFKKARQWFSTAATDDSAVAQRHLGEIYANGWGVEKSKVQAYAWYDYAAKNGDDVAENLRRALLKTMTGDEVSEGERLAKKMSPLILQQAPGNGGAGGTSGSSAPNRGGTQEPLAPKIP